MYDFIVLQTKICDIERPFKCSYSGQCLRNSKLCDGYNDCTDGSDEDVNFCKV